MSRVTPTPPERGINTLKAWLFIPIAIRTFRGVGGGKRSSLGEVVLKVLLRKEFH
jgi:hypothetical protein